MTKKSKHLLRSCAICEKEMTIYRYPDKTYRGGHYFGKIPLYRKGAWEKVKKFGMKKVRIGDMTFDTYKKEPKPYKYVEYWECPSCYWK